MTLVRQVQPECGRNKFLAAELRQIKAEGISKLASRASQLSDSKFPRSPGSQNAMTDSRAPRWFIFRATWRTVVTTNDDKPVSLAEIRRIEALLGDLEATPDEVSEAPGAVLTLGSGGVLIAISKIEVDETTPGILGDAGLPIEAARGASGTASSEIAHIEELLGDLEIDPKAWAETIDDQEETDAAVEEALADEGKRGKADKVRALTIDFTKPDIRLDEKNQKKLELKELLRSAITRMGGAITDDDPLALEKRMTAAALKKVGRNLGDLSKDWDRLERISRDGARSRQSEFYKVYEAGKAEMANIQRRIELAKLGRPPNYDHLTADEKVTCNARLRKRRQRDSLPKRPTTPSIGLAFADVSSDGLRDALVKMARRLDDWSAFTPTPRARQLRKPEHQKTILKAAAIYARHFHLHGRPPSQGHLAKKLHCNDDQAARKLRLLKALCEPEGPWHSVTRVR